LLASTKTSLIDEISFRDVAGLSHRNANAVGTLKSAVKLNRFFP
jgi:hypothetical protein